MHDSLKKGREICERTGIVHKLLLEKQVNQQDNLRTDDRKCYPFIALAAARPCGKGIHREV